MIRHYFRTIKSLWRGYWQRREVVARINSIREEIAEERLHQIIGHGWTATIDGCYVSKQLKYAAMALAFDCDYMWPWGKERYSGGRHTERERLVKVAALLMAEIDRVDRCAGDGYEARQPV